MAAVANAPRVATDAEIAGAGRDEDYFSANYSAVWPDTKVIRDTFAAHKFCTDEQLRQAAQAAFDRDYYSEGGRLIAVAWAEG